LTLDAKDYHQTVFLANRDGGANLSVWSGPNKNDNYVSVQAVPNPSNRGCSKWAEARVQD